MDHVGIDVHKRESQICLLAEGGELIGDSGGHVRNRFVWSTPVRLTSRTFLPSR